MSRIFGKRVYTRTQVGEPQEWPFMMLPEAETHTLVLTHEIETWKRKRAWWGTRREGLEIRADNPPQFAGKGENSWDCGDDAIYGMTAETTDPEEAVAQYIREVIQMRERRGMPSALRAS